MRQITKTLSEIHLYNGKLEYFIKLIIWAVCWIGGVGILRNSTDGVGSAYFIFSLALLMEFAPRIQEKKELASKIAHSVFCFASGTMLILATLMLLSAEYNNQSHNIMYAISLIIMVYMLIDCIILWISKESDDIPTKPNSIGQNSNNQIQKFNQNLTTGKLGNINAR